MKRAIICFPKISNIIWSQTQFPIGIYKIKAYCREKYEIVILDERVEADIDEKIEQLLDASVLCLGLSVMTGEQIHSAIRLSRKYHRRVKIAWGGVHPTILPLDTIKEEYVDYVIRGDGEEAFLNLLTYLDTGKVETELFLSKSNNNLNINYFAKLDGSNIDFELEHIKNEYFIKRDGFKKSFSIETSRGCPHKCAFCHNTILGHKYRTVDSQYVLNAIDLLCDKYGIDGITFQEDNFFLDIKRVDQFIDYLIKNNRIGWKANSRLSYFDKLADDEKLMNKLMKSNCSVLQFGIESGSNRILNLINKRIVVEDVIRINKKLARYSIKLRYNFIIGFPTETIEEIHQTIGLINRLMEDNENVEPPFVNIYTPYPGTPIFDLAVNQGFIPPNSLEGWANINWNQPNNSISDEKIRQEICHVSNKFLNQNRYLR